ncbi:hypothetical protein ADIAL_2018 [Alkalibacterium sp. AK22]|uniref:DUF2188 domain-containing protein n=1 Tax=Alkalibacterium sp. AK22 TaxID=1229520 RepID=UPI000452CD25|nr:DUF2188 domain-containing protein [Alkalibacterium sp. AK22]EXJ22432.1 hypothetical protein ADIAL_2018 [Alkalibacterium sp. AK22]
MPWDMTDYPDSFKNLDHVVKKKAIAIANALLDNGYSDSEAIPIATKQAKEWAAKASEDEIRSFKYDSTPKKDDSHQDTTNEQLLDNDVLVYFESEHWIVRTKEAKQADSTFKTKSEAISRAEKIADNKSSAVITYTKDGNRQ